MKQLFTTTFNVSIKPKFVHIFFSISVAMSDQKTESLHFSTELEKCKIEIAKYEINRNTLKNNLSTFVVEKTKVLNTLDEIISKLENESEQCLVKIEQKQEQNMSLESSLKKLIEEEKALLNARSSRSESEFFVISQID